MKSLTRPTKGLLLAGVIALCTFPSVAFAPLKVLVVYVGSGSATSTGTVGGGITAGPATTLSVTVTPAVVNVPITGATAAQTRYVAMTWTVTRTGASVTPSSSGGTFALAGSPVAQDSVMLSSGEPCTASTQIYTLTENLAVPPQVVQQAYQAGLGSFTYQRLFNGVGPTVQIALVGGSGAGGFGVERIALRFDDGSPVRVVTQGDSLSAYAEVTYDGTGLLQGEWQLADSASTQGTPIFRTLSLVHEQLAGGGRIRLVSPQLPTQTAGVQLLRLRIDKPVLPGATLTIRYFVGAASAARQPPVTLALLTPPAGGIAGGATQFSWQPVQGAKAYQLEIYEAGGVNEPSPPSIGGGAENLAPARLPSGPMVSGMLVPGTRHSVGLSAVAQQSLRSGQGYVWRVVAIGADGDTVGVSPFRKVNRP